MLSNSSLAASRLQQMAGLSPGDDVSARLEADFGPLCAVANQVDVIDPYAVTDALRSGSSSGLVRFLAMADDRGVARVRLLTGVGAQLKQRTLTPADIAAAAGQLVAQSASSSIEVQVVVVDSATRKALMHDRFVGFYWGSAGQLSWTLGKGFSQYTGRRARAHHAVSRMADGFVSGSAAALERRAVLTVRVA